MTWWRAHALLGIVLVCVGVLTLGGLGYWRHVHQPGASHSRAGKSDHRGADAGEDQKGKSSPAGEAAGSDKGKAGKTKDKKDSSTDTDTGSSGSDSSSGGSGGVESNPPGNAVTSFSPSYWSQWSNGPSTSASWFPIAIFDNDPFYNDSLVKAANINLYLGLFDFGSQYSHYVTNGLIANNSLAMAGEAIDADMILGDPIGASHIWGYQPADEPEMKHYTVSEVQAFYDEIRAKDTSRPIFIGYGKGLSLPQPQSNFFLNAADPGNYCDIPDVVAADYYGPQDAASGPDGQWVYGRTMDLMRAACGVTKPIWNYVDTEQVNSPGDPGGDLAAPTPLEIQQHVWLSIVHGANGIIYFCHNFGDTSDPQWDTKCLIDPPRTAAITETNAQLTKYARVLNSPTRENAVTISGDIAKITTLTKYLDGYAYIFAMTDGDAAHPDSGSTSAKFKIDKLGDATVQVLDESRNLHASDGSFSDNFTPYQWHIYKVKM
jgi:hypothetical protein